MKYHLAEVNIARFRNAPEDPVNAGFMDNLDRVNAAAEGQDGFIWRFTGAGNDAMDVQVFPDPNIAFNMSIWRDQASLMSFVYRNNVHSDIMRRRKEWFDKMDFHLVMWWIEEGRLPTAEEARLRLSLLQECGPTASAFTFAKVFPAPAAL